MTEDEIKKIPNIPGIYCIRNVVNGKCYIGQSVFLKRKLLHHLSNINTKKFDAPLYRAISKYGIDSFSVSIIESFDTRDFTSIKPVLDELEKKYIIQYNSYGCAGYNQTTGGDAGITGYKTTDEQQMRVSINARKYNTGKCVYAYDIITGYTYFSINVRCLAGTLGDYRKRSRLSRIVDKDVLYQKRLLITTNKEDLKKRAECIYNSSIQRSKNKRSLTVLEYYQLLLSMSIDMKVPSQKDIQQITGMCKKTVCNYNKRLLENGLIEYIGYHKAVLKIQE